MISTYCFHSIDYPITTQICARYGFDVSNRYQKTKSMSRDFSSYAFLIFFWFDHLKQHYVEFLPFWQHSICNKNPMI